MSRTRLLLLLSAGAVILWGLAGCSDNSTAPPPDNALASCFTCHGDTPGSSTYSLLAIENEYNHSLHATGTTWQRRTSPCLGCHTNEGFIERVQLGDFPAQGLSNSSPIHCWTCHAPHTNGNFNFRAVAAVTFIDGGGTFNYGTGNVCANCHQNRAASPAVPAAGTDSVRITSSRWGPHHAPQANMFAGKSGFFSTAHPAVNSAHTTDSRLTDVACVRCHMYVAPDSITAISGVAGGHSWRMTAESESGGETDNTNACLECHGALPDFDYDTKQTELTALLATVQARLLAAGLIDTSDLIPGTPRYITGSQLKAIWNYNMVLADRSMGVHNFKYAEALLNSALDFVPGPAPQVAKN
jgi:hypothetical protein